MDDTSLVTQNFEFICIECQNPNKLSENMNEGEVVECEFCGIEYEISEITADGQYILQIVEEEK